MRREVISNRFSILNYRAQLISWAFFFVKFMKKTKISKKLILVVSHSSWWKKKKYRKETFYILKKYKDDGYNLKKIKNLEQNPLTIDSRVFKEYFLLK